MKPTTILAAALAVLAAPLAAEEPAPRSSAIKIADLELDTPQGQRALDRRVARAAKEVCRTVDLSTGTRLMNSGIRRCYNAVGAAARQQVAQRQAGGRLGG